MTDYNTLVRDKIPELLKAQGQKPISHRADDPEFLEKVRAKLLEETDKFIQGGDPGQLIDLVETAYALGEAMGLNEATVNKQRELTRQERGGFDKKVILERVE